MALGLIAPVTLVAAVPSGDAHIAAVRELPGRIVYTCGPGFANLCSVLPNDTGRRVLTRDGKLNSGGFRWYTSPSLSTNGKRLAFAFGHHAYAADSSARRRRLLPFGRVVDGVALRPDGRRVLILDADVICPSGRPGAGCYLGHTAASVDWNGGNLRKRAGFFTDATWMSPSRIIAIPALTEGQNLLRLPESGCCGRALPLAGTWLFRDVAVSPDGRTIAVSADVGGGGNARIALISPGSQQVRLVTPLPPRGTLGRTLRWPAWSPDGKWLVWAANKLDDPGGDLYIARAIPDARPIRIGVVGAEPTWGG